MPTTVKNINTSKTTCPDGIPPIILQKCAEALSPSITLLFNLSLDKGSIPDEWKLTNVIPIHKKGNKKLLVFSPAFVADCLETIEEIGGEYNELFQEHGGEKLQLVESLNDTPLFN